MVGSGVVITRIILRSPLQPRRQTFRRLRDHPRSATPARPSSLRLHLPQRHKRQRKDLLGAAAKRISLPLLFLSQMSAATLKLDWFNQSSFGYKEMRQRTGRKRLRPRPTEASGPEGPTPKWEVREQKAAAYGYASIYAKATTRQAGMPRRAELSVIGYWLKGKITKLAVKSSR